MAETGEITAVREGARWRYARPSGEEVADWFTKSVHLDDGLDHEHYVSGLVLIPATEKVKRQVLVREGVYSTEQSEELTFTPYMRVDARVAYFHALGAALGLIPVIEPVDVPQIADPGSAVRNENLPPGYWWYAVDGHRALCCTMLVALYDPEPYFAQKEATNVSPSSVLKPRRFGVSTKAIAPLDRYNNFDLDAIAKAETGAIGRALGVAGILVVGTGIATAEDMAEHKGEELAAAQPTLPPPVPAPVVEETDEQLTARAKRLEVELRPHAAAHASFIAWWDERKAEGGWEDLGDAPVEVRKGLAARMEAQLRTLRAYETVQ